MLDRDVTYQVGFNGLVFPERPIVEKAFMIICWTISGVVEVEDEASSACMGVLATEAVSNEGASTIT